MPLPLPPRLQQTIRSRLELPTLQNGGPPQEAWREPSEGWRSPSHALAAKSQRASALPWPPAPPPMSAADITRALRRFRYDPEFRGDRRVPIRTLAALVGLSHETLYQAMMRRVMSHRTRAKLTWAIQAILDGRLRFRRHGQVWQAEGEGAINMLDDQRWRRAY